MWQFHLKHFNRIRTKSALAHLRHRLIPCNFVVAASNGHQLLLQLSWSWDTWLLSLGDVVDETGRKAAAYGNLTWHFLMYSSNWASQLPKSPLLNASVTSTQFWNRTVPKILAIRSATLTVSDISSQDVTTRLRPYIATIQPTHL